LLAALLVAWNLGAEPPPNFLVLMSDDHRADALGAMGNTAVRTPVLDRLAGQGTVFTRAYGMGAMQGAVCVPSRAMFLSGRTLFRVSSDLRDVCTWPEQLRLGGYRTFITGKWHNAAPSLQRVFTDGEAVFLGGMTDQFAVPVRDLDSSAGLSAPRIERRFSGEVFADAAIRFLQRQTGAPPFGLYVAFTIPHDPRTAPPESRAAYDSDGIPLPAAYRPVHAFDIGELAGRDEKLLPWPRTPQALRGELADYYAVISALDLQIGRILEALRARGLDERTIVVFAGDNGLGLGSHGLLGKQSVYEHSTRVPLIFSGPGIPRGRRSDAFCYLLDVCPTLAELAGVRPPPGSEGRSLAPILRGSRGALRPTVFTAYRHFQRALRDDRWKLMFFPELDRWQLFDLRRDPEELRDLAGFAGYSARVERMHRQLIDARRELEDPVPDPGEATGTLRERIRRQQRERRVVHWSFDRGRRGGDWDGDFEVVEPGAGAGEPTRCVRAVAGESGAGPGVRLRLQVQPPLPVGARSLLRFRYRLEGAEDMTVQMFDLTVQDNRHIRRRDLPLGRWSELELDFTRDSQRNDGTRDVFAAGNVVDDIFFLVPQRGGQPPALWVDDVSLIDAAP
jgi:arylsulfatase A-like enzyme